MAAQDPPQGHEESAADAMMRYGINGILGTGGGKSTAGRKQG